MDLACLKTPFSSRIIQPVPMRPLWESKAASTLIFTRPSGGFCQFEMNGCCGGDGGGSLSLINFHSHK
nr:hypothetical protein Iba_chr05fCG0210 [Ipomoea batatas]